MNLQTQEAFARPGNRPAELVYFIQARTLGHIKIGIAWSVQSRLRGLQTACSDELVVLGLIRDPNPPELERELHKAFAHERVRGEWFNPSADLLRFIEEEATLLRDDLRARRARGRKPPSRPARKAPAGTELICGGPKAVLARYKAIRGIPPPPSGTVRGGG